MLKRDDWLDLARKLDWDLSYVAEKDAFPEVAERAALAAARRVGAAGTSRSAPPTPSTSPASTRRRRRSPRCARRSAASRTSSSCRRAGSSGAQAARRDAAARRVRGGGRQPARGALRPRQRLADGGAARRARRAAPHADPAPADARAGALGSAVRLDAQASSTRTTGSRSPRATSSTSCCSASDAIEFAIATNFVFETGFTNLQFVGLSALAHGVGDRMFEKMVGSIQSDEARHAQIGAPVLATVVEARSRATRSTCSTSGSGAAGCCSRSSPASRWTT